MQIDIPTGVVDAHVHTATFFPALNNITFTIKNLKKIMKTYKVAAALVMPGYNNNMALENKRLIKLSKSSDNFYVLLRDCGHEYLAKHLSDKVLGLKVNPSQSKARITNPCYVKHLEVLDDNSGILMVHCGRWLFMSAWYYALEVAVMYPNIKVIFGHMGGTHHKLSLACIGAAKKVPNIYLETSQTRQPLVLKTAVKEIPDRLLFGSDMPWGDYLTNLVSVKDFGYDVLRGNFEKLVGL